MLFDHAEPSPLDDEAYAPYGNFGFPAPPAGRPWIYSNFVQSLDGITTLLGKHGSGGEISQSREDRWLMDLLRAHADGLLMGMNTLLEEQRSRGPESRGIVFQVADPKLRALRQRLGKGRERNIFVTRAADLDLSRLQSVRRRRSRCGGSYLARRRRSSAVTGAVIRMSRSLPRVRASRFDLPLAIRKLRDELGVEYLLCEGGPTLYGSLARADLVDEKFMTVSPVEVGQIVPPEQERLPSEAKLSPLLRPTVFGGPGFTRENITHWSWLSCRKVGDHQFNRYRRRRN